jgi:hypothetical protein
MPDTSGGQGGGGTGLGATLKQKMGPMPVWGWLALITVLGLGYWLYAQHKSGGTSAAQTAGGSPASVGQPGVVVINQGGPEPGREPGPERESDRQEDREGRHPIPHQPGGGSKPPEGPESRLITLDKNETLAQLAKQRHWTSGTLRQVEEMNVTQGGGELTPKSKLREGTQILRPLGGG